MGSENYIERMKAEQLDLGDKMRRLFDFLGTQTFHGLPEHERWLLYEQHQAMDRYSRILLLRIALCERREGTL